MNREAGRERSLPRSTGLLVICAVAGLATVALTALGVWQLQRRIWKLDLIAQVEQRVKAPPQDLPGRDAWASINAAGDAYRHVRTEGVWIEGHDTPVQAVTARGGGFWVMTPLRTDAGFIVLVNRGFVPAPDNGGLSEPPVPANGRTVVTGLLRISEPKGGFLRSNDPAAGRWFSRDAAAIAAAHGLRDTAPYFVDAERVPGIESPLGGMTVVDFPNSHLVYALTWFALAAMTLGGAIYLVRDARRPAATSEA